MNIAQVEQLYSEGRVNAAIGLIDDLLKDNPDHHEARLLKTEILLKERKGMDFVRSVVDDLTQQAHYTDREISVLDDAETWAFEMLEKESRRWLSATRRINRLLALAPESAGLHFQVARMLMEASPDSDLPAFLRFRPDDASKSIAHALFDKVLNLAAHGSDMWWDAFEALLHHPKTTFTELRNLMNRLEGMDEADEWVAMLQSDTLSKLITHAEYMLRHDNDGAVDDLLAALPNTEVVLLLRAELALLGGLHDPIALCEQQPDEMPVLSLAEFTGMLSLAATVDCNECDRTIPTGKTACPRCGHRENTLILDQLPAEDRPIETWRTLIKAQALTKQGQFEQAYNLMKGMEGFEVWKQDLDKHRQQILFQQRLDAGIALMEEGRLDEARQHLYDMIFDPHNEGEAFAWLALVAARQGLTPDDRVIMGRAAWGPLSQQQRRDVIQAVLNVGWIAVVDEVLPAMFGDTPPHDIQTAYQQARWDRITDRITAAYEAIDQGHIDTAIGAAREAYQLAPHEPQVQLVLGYAETASGNAYGAAERFRRLLESTDVDSVHRDAVLGLAQAYEGLGDLWAAHEALAPHTGDPEIQAALTRIEQRLHRRPATLTRRMPHIVEHDRLRRTTFGGYQSVFGVQVAAATRWKPGQNGLAPAHLLQSAYAFVAALGALYDPDYTPAIEMRVISTAPKKLTLVLLFSAVGQTADEAETRATTLWEQIQAHLPMVDDHLYDYQPLFDERRLTNMLEPFPIGDVAEIGRRASSQQRDYSIEPFGSFSVTLRDVVATLLRHPHPAMLTLHLEPTQLLPWERDALTRHGEQMRQMRSQPEMEMSDDGSPEFVMELPDESQQRVAHLLMNFEDVLDQQAFLLRMVTASGAEKAPMFHQAMATWLFGPEGTFTILKPHTDKDKDILRHNLAWMQAEAWAPHTWSEDLVRLRYLAGTSEAAGVFRLPMPSQDGIEGLPRQSVKAIPPVEMATEGTILGETVTTEMGQPIPVRISQRDRRRHMYVVGKTGVGKSTLLEVMALQDISEGRGVAILDPHGDLVESVLTRIPAERASDVIVFDPSDETRPVGLNFIQAEGIVEQNRVATEFVQMLVKMYDPGTMGIAGPIFQQDVTMAILTALQTMDDPTLLDVVRIISDYDHAKTLVDKVKDPVVRTYWEKQQANTRDYHRSERLSYVISKFNRFVGDIRVRHIVGQAESSLDFRDIMDNNKILLVNLSKGLIGRESASFLGMLLLQSLLKAALSRTNVSQTDRIDFCLYVDEFQSFATETFEAMLSEGRKYGLCLVMANQFTSQLPNSLRQAVFGNVGSLVAFNMGMADAELIAPELYPTFSRDDLITMPRFTAAIRLLMNGEATRPFAMRTRLSDVMPDAHLADRLRQLSRHRYGRDVESLRQRIAERMG